jgi:hypothetical protein
VAQSGGTAALIQPAARTGTPMSDLDVTIIVVGLALSLAAGGIISQDRRRSWLLLLASLALAAGAVVARVAVK